MRFEYLVLDSQIFERKRQAVEQQLNDLGSEGWELVAACGVHNQTFVFMRAVGATNKKTRSKADSP